MESRFKFINEIFGGYSEGEVFSVYGQPTAGKTLFMLYEMGKWTNEGKKIIYIDTEGGFKDMYNEWKEKFGINENKVVVRVKRDLRALLHYLGEDVDFETSNKGKISLVLKGLVKRGDEDVIWRDLRKVNDYVIILDSLTAPITNLIPSTNENYPVRADVIGHVFGMLYRVMDEKESGHVVMLHHASNNPTNPYDNKQLLKGGNRVVYMSKKIMLIEKPKAKAMENIRKIIAIRTPKYKGWEKYSFLEYGDNGIKEVDEEYVMEIAGKKK